MGVFEMRKDKKCGVFGVTLQARVPLHQICLQKCFWTPGMWVFEMRYFRCPHPRYPKPLLLADLVQRYAPLGNHAKNRHFLALCISKTVILVSKNTLAGRCSAEVCAPGAPRQKPHFLALRSANIPTSGRDLVGYP